MEFSSSLETTEKVLPYQFQPYRDSGDENSSDSAWETVEEDSDVEEEIKKKGRNEVSAENWCKCGHCQQMFLAEECICCKELEETKTLIEGKSIECITDHDGYDAVCLNKDVLWTAIVNLGDQEGAYVPERNNIPNRTYRYSSYRQFTWWVHNRLGRHVRRIIPSCAISRIRAEFEEDHGNYTRFEGADVIASEIANAMEWKKIDEDD